MIKTKRIGPLTLTTPDLEGMVGYYSQTIGLEITSRSDKRAILSTQVGQEAIILEAGATAGIGSLSFQISPTMSLDEATAFLNGQGVASVRRALFTPSIGDAVSFTDAAGITVNLFSHCGFLTHRPAPRGVAPLKLGHAAFFTTDVQRAADFYQQILGFRVSDWKSNTAVFLRCGIEHHVINFFKSDRARLHHLAFETKDYSDLCRVSDFLTISGFRLDWGPGRHNIGHNIACYHSNSDKVRVEVYTEMDIMPDEELGYFAPRPWHQDRPQFPKVWPDETPRNYWVPDAP
jgi:catechol 2,3-dioxygenase-like lactoylglutathione lyase family enzyme